MQTANQTLIKVKEALLNDIKNNCKELQFFMNHLKASDLFEYKTKTVLLEAVHYFTVVGQTYETFSNMAHNSPITAYSKKYPIPFGSLIQKISRFNDYINPETSYVQYIESIKNTDWYVAYSRAYGSSQLDRPIINEFTKNSDTGIFLDIDEMLRMIKLTMEN